VTGGVWEGNERPLAAFKVSARAPGKKHKNPTGWWVLSVRERGSAGK